MKKLDEDLIDMNKYDKADIKAIFLFSLIVTKLIESNALVINLIITTIKFCSAFLIMPLILKC
jgi:hypothetical protein